MAAWLRVVLGAAWLLLAGPAAAEAPDRQLALALRQAEAGDWAAAEQTAQAAMTAARSPEQVWAAQETRATIAHWRGDHPAALALLEPLLAQGAQLFGPESPRLILGWRMLGATQRNMGDDAAAIRAQIRAVVLARGNAGQDLTSLLATMADLARSYIDLGQNAAAAILSTEAIVQSAYDAGGERPGAQEARMLRALAHLRMDHPAEAVLQALPVYRLEDADLTPEADELLGVFDAELSEAAAKRGAAQAVADGWVQDALAREAGRQTDETAMTDALLPLMEAMQSGDIIAADAVARVALQSVLADDPLVVNVYFALLTGLLNADRPDLAVAWADRLAAIAPGYLASLAFDPGQSMRPVADFLLQSGRPAEAVPLARAMAEVAGLRDGENALGRQLGLTLQGDAARRAGQWDLAAQALGSALTIAQNLGTAGELAGDSARLNVQALVNLGLLAEDQGQIATAEARYTDAVGVLQSTDAGDESAGWSLVLGQLGGLYTTAGRLDEAEGLLQKSLDLAVERDGEQSRNVALSLYELARLQAYAGKVQAASDTARRAIAIARATMGADDPDLTAIYLMQAGLLERTGQPKQARAALEAALTAAQAGLEAGAQAGAASGGSGTRSSAAALLMQQAVLQANEGALSDARSLMARALADALPQDPIYPHLQAAAGAIALKDNDLPGALDLFRLATADLTKPERRAEPSARDHLPLHVDTARRLSDAARGVDAVNLMAEAFAVAQRVNEISAGQALNKAAARLRGGSGALADLARKLEADLAAIGLAKAALLDQLSKGSPARAQRVALEAAEADYGRVQNAIDAGFPRYAAFANPKPNDMLATMALLGPDEVLILFATSDMTGFNDADSGTVIALTDEGYIAAGLPPRAEVETLARALRCAAALTDRGCGTARGQTRGAFSLETPQDPDPQPDFDLAQAYRAYQMLLAPVSDAFAGKSTLIIVPDKALAALPFHLMLTAAPDASTTLRNAPWLLRDLAVMVVPTVASLASLRGPDARPSAGAKPFLGIGDPLIGVERGGALPYDCAVPPETGIFAASLAPDTAAILRGSAEVADGAALAALPALPETRCELAATAQLLGTPDALMLQGDATETNLKALSETGALLQYRTLSFATHGLIAGEIGSHNAGLVLTPPAQPDATDDGLLTTAEIANLRLDADFILLSACNTAAGATGRDEGLSGLASAFFLAGARSLMVSHWPVYSDAATRLTAETFAALDKTPGIGRAQALRRAMLAVLDDPAATPAMLHPAWWGPFMIAGEGGAARN